MGRRIFLHEACLVAPYTFSSDIYFIGNPHPFLLLPPRQSHEELRLSRIYLAFCNDCCGVTEAARRDGGAAEGKAALAEEEEGAPKGPKALLMVVKDVLRGLFTNAGGEMG